MAIATVNVIQSILTSNGWLAPGQTTMDADEARAQPPGYLEIISVDGVTEIHAACCSSEHP